MISKVSIDKIFSSVNIVTAIQEFVSLQKEGDKYIGVCPFHKEQTKSMLVLERYGLFRCLECEKGGNVVNFIMEHEKLNFEDAVRFLAKRYNIEVVEEEEDVETIENTNKIERMMKATEWSQNYLQDQLNNTEEGQNIALAYLKHRGISEEAIKTFGIGYCPSEHGILTKTAEADGISIESLEQAGVTIKRDDWIRDRFESRITFPIHNILGQVIGFGGRTMAENKDKKIAKYVNSPESDIYHKSHVLYGIALAKSAIVEREKCYIVEGYTDVIGLQCAGVTNVVASAGTALTIEQIKLLRRFTNKLCMIYDGDAAGISASFRGVERILKEGMEVQVIPLPDGEDPDSFSRSMSNEELLDYLKENEIDFIQFASKVRIEETQNDPIKRAEATSEIVRLISVISDKTKQMDYMKECSLLMKIREENLYQELRRFQQQNTEQYFKQQNYSNQIANPFDPPAMVTITNPFEKQEKEVLRFLLKYGDRDLMEEPIEGTEHTRMVKVSNYILEEVDYDGFKSVDPIIQLIFEQYKEESQKFNFEAGRFFILHTNVKISKLCAELLTNKYEESDFWKAQGGYIEKEEDVLANVVPRVVEEYKLIKVKSLLDELNDEMNTLNSSDDFERQMEILKKIQNLNELKRQLSISLGNRTIY